MPSLVGSRGGAAIADPCRTLILHCFCIPTKLQMGLASLFTAYTRCMQVLPLLLLTCVAGGTAYPYRAWDCLCFCRPVSQRDCLPTLAFHVNVYALTTPPPWSILSLFQPPLQRTRNVVTVVTLASTYCLFPVCGNRQEFRESPFMRPERASLSFAFLLYLPPLWRAARPRSESSVGDPVIICLLFHLPTFMARGPSGPAYHCLCLSEQFAPVMARGPSSSERSVGGPVIICLLFHLPTFIARGPSGPAFHCLSAQLWRAARAGQLIIAFLCKLPPLWRAARPRNERSVGGPVIICLLFHLPTFMALPERASFSLPFCPIFHRYGARPKRASLSLPSAQFSPRSGTRPVLGASAP